MFQSSRRINNLFELMHNVNRHEEGVITLIISAKIWSLTLVFNYHAKIGDQYLLT